MIKQIWTEILMVLILVITLLLGVCLINAYAVR
jgi:hypothetical protein